MILRLFGSVFTTEKHYRKNTTESCGGSGGAGSVAPKARIFRLGAIRGRRPVCYVGDEAAGAVVPKFLQFFDIGIFENR